MTTISSASAAASPSLSLNFAFEFADLYRRDGLARLDQVFLERLGEWAPALVDRLREARTNPDSIELRSESELLIALAPHLEDFIAELVRHRACRGTSAGRHHELAPLYACKRLFVQRKAMARIKADEAAKLDGLALEAELAQHMGGEFSELGFARLVTEWQKDEAAQCAESGNGLALRGLGRAHAGRTRTASRGHSVQSSGQARLSASRAGQSPTIAMATAASASSICDVARASS